MRKLLKLALGVVIAISITSCSGVSSKYPPSGDMDKDAKALVEEILKDNPDEAKYKEMASSYETYYKDKGKIKEFEKAIEKAMTDVMTKELEGITNGMDKKLDEAVDEAVDEAIEKANKELEKK